jgi:hypothetical protein
MVESGKKLGCRGICAGRRVMAIMGLKHHLLRGQCSTIVMTCKMFERQKMSEKI